MFGGLLKGLCVVKAQHKYKVQNNSSLIFLPHLEVTCLFQISTSLDMTLTVISKQRYQNLSNTNSASFNPLISQHFTKKKKKRNHYLIQILLSFPSTSLIPYDAIYLQQSSMSPFVPPSSFTYTVHFESSLSELSLNLI